MNRVFDIVFSFIGLILGFPVLLILIVIGYFDTGSPIFVQERVGKNLKPFKLIKFRTMKVGTSSVASHLVQSSSITSFGSFIRKTKLDELPQLINVFLGQMSLVGPRPNLFNQEQLISERQKLNIYDHKPGITGLAQLRNIDMSTPKLLAETDSEMISNMNLKNYFRFIFQTAIGGGSGDAVK
jgi:lipopolysaccharide/colanic/teichoic acid biosynthesis glycosyltransferase